MSFPKQQLGGIVVVILRYGSRLVPYQLCFDG